MAVTAQQIADLAGVSRGTVDRALHNRGRVNPEVKEKIQKIALELGYKPNLIGQALVRSKQDFKLGVILQSTETPTMQVVRAGVQRAASVRFGSTSSISGQYSAIMRPMPPVATTRALPPSSFWMSVMMPVSAPT